MAVAGRRLCGVFVGCHTHLLTGGQSTIKVPSLLRKQFPVRQFAAVRFAKKQQKNQKEEKTKPKKERVVGIKQNNAYGATSLEPVDDVYRIKLYPKPVYGIETAIDLLKKWQRLDFTYPMQPVYVDLLLDMKLEKKKKVDQFVGTVQLPFPFKKTTNKVVVFTENPEQAAAAQEHGAAFVGGTELIDKILENEIEADFYVTVPSMVTKLLPLKNKLRKKFPKSKRGSVGLNILQMLETFKTGHEYITERDCCILTKVGTVDMPREHIVANIAAIITDVCTYRPVSFGPFVERAIICSATSESLLFKVEPFLPQVMEEEKEEQDVNH
ncbi:39S ribosomal protein L1, mitochondrial [Callorhinchus milii]|uniref:Mitochondrial ribosomal protein L1 n=1 Tax=Callorhinchus milii TaxID=7868 RepID=V9KVE7_CALMI|nr:39S ribosomal protein L1, mitochondrial [Callorhinchus milii]|eukprot:gi/632958684/ref/XP_007895179.1/ PREDICTED: 39S ribosomal protein L1, mitochondrial [Callorhinchus milii]